MSKESWYGKTGQVMYEGYFKRTDKGAATKKRKWGKLLWNEKSKQAWIVYLHISDTKFKDADGETIREEINDRYHQIQSQTEIYKNFMRVEGIIPLSEMSKFIIVSQKQFDLYGVTKSGKKKMVCRMILMSFKN